MSFDGQIFQLLFTGSFNGNANVDQIPAGDYASDSRNINTHNGGAEKRGGTAPVNSPAISGNPVALGGGQLIKRTTGTEHIYVAADDGKVYRNYTTAILTGRSAVAKTNFTAIDDEMYICNGVNDVQVDTGSAVATITTPAADWTGTNQPKKIVVHGRGSSRRAFAWGVAGKENTLYYSSLGDFQEFSGGTSGTIVVDIRDGVGIVDCISIDENLLIRSRNQDYWLDDSDTTPSNWGYFKTGWQGGVHSEQLSVHIYNDVYTMSTDGEIYTISRAEQIRNYRRASIARPFFIHHYISDNIDLTKIDQFHMSFDPRIQAIKIWVVRTGQTECDTALVYYVNEQRWAPPHDAQENSNDSGYHAAVSFSVSVSDEEMLYTGDYNGFVWKLEETTKSDNGNGYKSNIVTGWLVFDLIGQEKRIVYATLHHISRGPYDIDIKIYVDSFQQASSSATLISTGAVLGAFTLGTDILSAIGMTKQEFEIGHVGERFKFEFSNDGAGEDYFFSQILFPIVTLGHRRF